jgi:hypothetical protein
MIWFGAAFRFALGAPLRMAGPRRTPERADKKLSRHIHTASDLNCVNGAQRKRPGRRGLEPAAGTCHDATGLARHDQEKLPTHRAGRGLPQRIPPLPQRAMGETTLNKKMRAFDDEVALTIAPFYLVHMLQRALPAGFIAPCLPTKTDKLPARRGPRCSRKSGSALERVAPADSRTCFVTRSARRDTATS